MTIIYSFKSILGHCETGDRNSLQPSKFNRELYRIFWGTDSQNLHSKIAPSRGHLLFEKISILAIWLSSYFFMSKTFLIVNFQHLFDFEYFRETSQNFSSFRQLLFSFFLLAVGMSWNFARFHKFKIKQMLKISAVYLDKQKSFIPKYNMS